MPLIDRSGAAALMPEEFSREIIKNVPQSSAVMQLSRRAPNMSRKQRRMPVLSALPTAYFVNGEAATGSESDGLKQTTSVQWANKFLDAEELAVIVPIPEAVLDDSDYDIWGEIRPLLLEAFGLAFDQAVIFETNKPAAWPRGIMYTAQRSNNIIVLGTNSPDIAADVGDTGGLMGLVEEDGFDVSGFAGAVGVKARLRGLRGSDDTPIFNESLTQGTPSTLYGQPMFYVKNGAWTEAAATAPEVAGEEGGAHIIGGDWSQSIYAMRQDITLRILREATIYDTDGTTILFRLAQQDMVALRAVMRIAWQVPNPINRLKQTAWSSGAAGDYRWPFAALTPAAV